jgi:hypothetical protein
VASPNGSRQESGSLDELKKRNQRNQRSMIEVGSVQAVGRKPNLAKRLRKGVLLATQSLSQSRILASGLSFPIC